MITNTANGTLNCPKNGKVTGIDCLSLMDSTCKECIIYKVIKSEEMTSCKRSKDQEEVIN